MAARDGAALLDAIYEAPHDDSARLVYADWLQDHGDPRGELIVLQLRSPRTAAQQARALALLEAHSVAWQGRLAPFTTWAEFERGFLARCELGETSRSVIGRREWTTVEHIAIVDGGWTRDELAELITHAMMKSLRSLVLPVDALAAILDSERKSPVERLTVVGAVDPGRVRRLAAAPIFDRVVALDIDGAAPQALAFEPIIVRRFERFAFTSRGWSIVLRRGADGGLSMASVTEQLRGANGLIPQRAIDLFDNIPDDALTSIELSLAHGARPTADLERAMARQRRLVKKPVSSG